jgi:transposase
MSILVHIFVVYCNVLWYNCYIWRCDMFLKKSISNGKVYLSFVQGYRKDGKSKQKTIEKIGYLEDLEKIYNNPISHFKAIAKERNHNLEAKRSIEILTNQRLEDRCSLRKNLGYAIPKRIYALLDIATFLQNKQRQIKQKYNLNQIFNLLVFNRFLFPTSKKKAYENKDIFFDSFLFSLDDIYRSLSLFAKYSKQLQAHVYNKVKKLVSIDSQIGYYDVTNFYFEIPYNDEDEYDKEGNLLKKGTRKKGPSKEHRKTPIIQMGLLMDANGIPMAFNTFPGNESEKTSILPAIRRLKKDYGMERVIAVADRGLNTSDNTAFLSGVNDDDSKGHDGYVYGQSVIGADKEFRKWVLDKKNYKITKELDENGEEIIFIHKSRIFAKTIQLKNQGGNRTLTMQIYQKQLAYYSKKYAEKQRKDRERVLEKAKDLIENPGKYTQATSYGATGYVKNLSFIKETGEIADGKNLSLNLKKIAEEEKYDGYYSIVTSEKELTDKEIRDIYRGLWKIEESFKIIKSEFKTRPIHVRLDEHIEAHFLICFVTLVIMRLLEHMINHQFSVKKIRESLINYGCSYLEQNYYLFDYRDDFLRTAEKIFDLDLGKKTMILSEIKNILKTTK